MAYFAALVRLVGYPSGQRGQTVNLGCIQGLTRNHLDSHGLTSPLVFSLLPSFGPNWPLFISRGIQCGIQWSFDIQTPRSHLITKNTSLHPVSLLPNFPPQTSLPSLPIEISRPFFPHQPEAEFLVPPCLEAYVRF